MTKEQNRQTIVYAILHRRLKLSNTKPTKTWDEFGCKVSNTKLSKTWDEFGIKGEQYETH